MFIYAYELSYLRFGTAVAACIGGGTVYGNGNFAATAGFSNNIFIAWFWLKLKFRLNSMVIFLQLRSLCVYRCWLLLRLPAADADGIVDTLLAVASNFIYLSTVFNFVYTRRIKRARKIDSFTSLNENTKTRSTICLIGNCFVPKNTQYFRRKLLFGPKF